jgi:hypothetical protein
MYRSIAEINCMMCGTQIGEVRDGRFTHHRGCSRPVELRGGFPRCCRCGGSLYMERTDNLTLSPRAYAVAPTEASRAS